MRPAHPALKVLVMKRASSFVGICIGLSILLASGCGPKKPTGPADVPVKGQVILDGKPLAEGQIAFFVQGSAPGSFPVSNGAFSGTAKEGTNRVEVRAFKDGPPLNTDPNKTPTKVNILPAKYNTESKLTADVKAGSANEFKFDVTSR